MKTSGRKASDNLDGAYRLYEQAQASLDLGNRAQAKSLALRALHIMEEAAEADDPDMANILNTLGHIHEDEAAYGKAEECYRRSVNIAAKISAHDRDLQRLRIQ